MKNKIWKLVLVISILLVRQGFAVEQKKDTTNVEKGNVFLLINDDPFSKGKIHYLIIDKKTGVDGNSYVKVLVSLREGDVFEDSDPVHLFVRGTKFLRKATKQDSIFLFKLKSLEK